MIHYRLPGLWAKAVTTLDVLSGGRACLGIGAAWNQDESAGLGFPMPPARRAFRDARGDAPDRPRDVAGRARVGRPFDGTHFQAARLLNSPQSLRRPHPPIMIGGGGEKKTLRLVAQYADATNVFGGPDMIARKYAILREHCEAVGRPFEEIERSTLQNTRLSADGRDGTETPDAAAARFAALAGVGAQHVVVGIGNIERPRSGRSRRAARRARPRDPDDVAARRFAIAKPSRPERPPTRLGYSQGVSHSC